MYVSNLFVYDAQGNPLHDVQIVDDRGRPVRTVADGSSSTWSAAGGRRPVAVRPGPDASGRERWNVYPLSGAPAGEWTWDEASGAAVLVPGASLQQPPAPFGAAEALAGTGRGAPVAAEPSDGSGATAGDAPTGSQAPTGATASGDGTASAAPGEPSSAPAPPSTSAGSSQTPADAPSPSGR